MTLDLERRLRALTALLAEHGELWRTRAFYHRVLPWEDELPELASWLRQLDGEHVAHLQRGGRELARALAPWLPWAPDLEQWAALPQCPQRLAIGGAAVPELPPALYADVPGRKWRQIEAFAAAFDDAGLPLLEWCAGKGHLGRYLGWCLQQRPVDSLEWQAELVASGAQLAARLPLTQRLHRQDVMLADVAHWLSPQRHVVALHACGDLHRRLVQLAPAQGVAALSLSPCCYHRGNEDIYHPHSAAAQGLVLARDERRTAVQETVTAPARVRYQRETLQAWRLGFDLLQRTCRGSDTYLPTPPVEPAWLRQGFIAFCRHLAALKQVPLQGVSDTAIAAFEAPGWQRQREVDALDLVRLLFRRPLELWMVLDLAVSLQTQGYSVDLGTFCPRELTPRNLLLQARR